MGLASLPIADAVAIFFVGPLIITLFPVVFLKEKVGAQRWVATTIGLIGVLVIVKPGTTAFQLISLLPLLAAVCYATLNILTRKIGSSESAATMALYIQLTFIFCSGAIGIVFGDGRFDMGENALISFLLRGWHYPVTDHFWILISIGVATAFGGFLISMAYKSSEAAFIAPFEYASVLMAIFWGLIVFQETPSLITVSGISLIVGSGIFVIYREKVVGKGEVSK